MLRDLCDHEQSYRALRALFARSSSTSCSQSSFLFRIHRGLRPLWMLTYYLRNGGLRPPFLSHPIVRRDPFGIPDILSSATDLRSFATLYLSLLVGGYASSSSLIRGLLSRQVGASLRRYATCSSAQLRPSSFVARPDCSSLRSQATFART